MNVEEVLAWANADPDAATRAEVVEALDRRDEALLDAWFGPRLAFGTAGLRGPIRPGPAGINRLVGMQTAYGWVRYLLTEVDGAAEAGVVIGYDGRRLSREIAHDAARICSDAGIAVTLVDQPAPTPLMAFLARTGGAAGAMVVTASHNPPLDNGIKVYGDDGAQIIPPVDARIAASIDAAAADTLRGAPGAPVAAEPGIIHTTGSVEDERYLEFIQRSVAPSAASSMTVATTSMHGVGHRLLHLALRAAGHAPVAVLAQRDPDPDFSTVSFPNPEEPGATDLLAELMVSIDAPLGIANDPDADRCAVLVAGPNGPVALSGNDVGALLAYRALRQGVGPSDLFVTTVVSSALLARMAAAAGAQFAETLTGFKWLCRPAFAHPELTPRLAYEEALGYSLGGAVDKDGIQAAVAVVDLAASFADEGRTLLDALEDLAADYGRHRTRQVSLRTASPIGLPFGEGDPSSFGGFDVERLDRPAADVVRVFCTAGHRVAFRPSGTEPKFKLYLEAVVRPDDAAPDGVDAGSIEHAEAVLDRLERAARDATLGPAPDRPVVSA